MKSHIAEEIYISKENEFPKILADSNVVNWCSQLYDFIGVIQPYFESRWRNWRESKANEEFLHDQK